MVKSIICILAAALLVFFISFAEFRFVETQFNQFEEELIILYKKTEEERAGEEDAKSLRKFWDERKTILHVLIPHNDIVRMDDWLSEAIGLIAKKDFPLALSKLEVLLQLCSTIPEAYRVSTENIF